MPSRIFELEPVLVLFGCRPFVPFHGLPPDDRGNDPPFHVPESHHESLTIPGSHWPPERCPVCKGRTKPRVHCAWCSLTERTRRQFVRIRASREAYEQALARAQGYTDEKQGVDRKTRQPKRLLTELERRHVARMTGPNGEPVGERWLRAIGQLPDWSLTLDRRGRPVSLGDLDGDIADGQQAQRLDQRSDDDQRDTPGLVAPGGPAWNSGCE